MKSVPQFLRNSQRNALFKLYKLYEGRSDQDSGIKFGLYAALYQLMAALTDSYYISTVFFGVGVAFFGGLAVSDNLEATIAIWLGTATICVSVVFGSILSIVFGDGFGGSKRGRLLIWVTTSLACILASYVALNFIKPIDELWLLCSMTLVVLVIGMTEFHFGDRWHCEQVKYRLETDTLANHLPKEFRGKIIRMNAIDKYTFVLTERGGVEIRMSLSRAIELCDDPGFRVHRSYWVAREYIQRPTKDGRKWYMEVEGERVPVSASFYNDIIGYVQFGYVPTAGTDAHLL